MHRKLLGYRSGNKRLPVFAPMPGALVTQVLIHCSQCRDEISPDMGPHRDTWCIPCTEKGEKTKEEEQRKERRKEEDERRQKAVEKAEELKRLKNEH